MLIRKDLLNEHQINIYSLLTGSLKKYVSSLNDHLKLEALKWLSYWLLRNVQ